jgi:Tat protein translocase TatB subunit
MFGLGMGELLVILAIALLVLGPSKLPDAAAALGKAIRQFRKATQDLNDQLEVDEEVRQPLRELKAALRNEPAPRSAAPSPAPLPKPAAPTSEPAAPTAEAAAPKPPDPAS